MTWQYQVKVDQPRCLLHRYNKSTCSRCFDVCRPDAIRFHDELVLDVDTCTSCMLCTSVCPTDALTIEDFSEHEVVSAISRASSPVIACSEQPGLKGHSNGPCLGYLSAEHLAAYSTLINKTIQLNMTACSDCHNGFVFQDLAERTSEADQGFAEIHQETHGLEFEEVSHSRRELLALLGIRAIHTVDRFISNRSGNGEGHPGFSAKTLPARYELLNEARGSIADSQSKARLDKYGFDLLIGASCDGCGACVAICPTGALTQTYNELAFKQVRCTGCGLCVEFCPQESLTLSGRAFESDTTARLKENNETEQG